MLFNHGCLFKPFVLYVSIMRWHQSQNNKLSTSSPTISWTFNIFKFCHNQDMFRFDQTIVQWKEITFKYISLLLAFQKAKAEQFYSNGYCILLRCARTVQCSTINLEWHITVEYPEPIVYEDVYILSQNNEATVKCGMYNEWRVYFVRLEESQQCFIHAQY
jgi:hypothetical protein